jgi:hypothetical protein
VVKITLSTAGYGAQGDACAYLKNLDRCNRFFADAIRFEGIVRLETDVDAIVISQPLVRGPAAAQEEIEDYFVQRGFRPAGMHSFEFLDPSGRSYFVADARPDNVIRDAKPGLICPIDVQIIVTEPSS